MSWQTVIEGNAASELTARRLVGQLRACEAAALAFCRLLERWGRGDANPATPGARQAALRHAADRVETALAGLERPLWSLHERSRERLARVAPREVRPTSAATRGTASGR